MYSDGIVPLEVGFNLIEVEVTAEDGTTQVYYDITVTRPLPLVVRSISPSTVAPGGTFEVTLDFDPARTGLTAVDEFLPDGFSWVDGDYGRLIYSGLDPTDSQTLFLTLFGMVSTVTYQVTASDMPGVYEITGTMLTGVGITEPVLGDTQITVALLPEVTVPLWDLTFDEGSSGTYAVRLGQQPTADVTVAITSDNTDVTVSPTSLTFTSANWNSRQTVTMNAAEDTDHNYDTAILTHTVTSTDPNYIGISVDSVDVIVIDNDVTVMFGAAAYEVPEGEEVIVTLTLSAALSAALLDEYRIFAIPNLQGGASNSDFEMKRGFLFPAGTTSATETFEAKEDDNDDDNESVLYTLPTDRLEGFDETSSEFLPHGVSVGTPATTTVSITDDDEPPGVTVSPTELTITEGGMDTYTVVLNAAPSADVTVAISSSNPDVTVTPNNLTFTSSDWETEQTVDVTAAEDADAADDTDTLTHNPSGGNYDSVSNAILTVTVTDDETAGVTVTPTSLPLNEGGTNTYTVVLDTQPTATVTVTIVDPTDNADVTADPASLTFTTSNWSTAKTVTVSAAEDDDSTEDTATVTHTVAGGDYGAITAQDVDVTVTDDDTPGITFAPTSLTVGEGGTGTYTVVLDTLPTGTVTVVILSNNTDVTASSSTLTSTLTFTTTNWNSAQTVTVTAGQDADAADDTATLTHFPSGADYDSLSDASLTVTVTDDDTRGVTVTPLSLPVDEGGTNTYTVVLDTEPTGTVTITIVDPTDNTDVTTNPASLTFSTSNWATAQTVTVSAAEDDDAAQDTATVTHTVSGGDYDSFAASSVTVTVNDDDTPGVAVSPTSLTVGEGDMGTYTVKLNTLPTGNVMVAISSSNTDVTVSPSPLTFTVDTWSTEQTVTVTAGQDADAADDTANLTHNPSGANYGSVSNAILTVTVTDNDTAGVTVTPTSLSINEGSTGTYTVKLDTQPTGSVTVGVSSGDTGAASVNRSTMTFTTTNWSSEQTVTVRGTHDDDSANESVTVTHTVSGGGYGSVTVDDVTVTVTDDDTPGLTASPTSLLAGEGTGFNSYTVVLNTQPSGDVTVAISSDNTDVTTSSSSLTFTTGNWNVAQRVTITVGTDQDGADESATLTHDPSGGGYDSVSDVDVVVTVDDADRRGVRVTPTSLAYQRGRHPEHVHRRNWTPNPRTP